MATFHCQHAEVLHMLLQHTETINTLSDAEQDDVEEDALALSSTRYENYEDYGEDSDAMSVSEQEETEEVVATLQLRIRALGKYKANYELLCGQLGELNAQIGLQLQRHEADVTALQASIADLQTENIALKAQVSEVQQALQLARDGATQDREYSEHVHRQLSTAAELLKATENRLEQQEENFAADIEHLRSHLAEKCDECEEYQAASKGLLDKLEAFQAREATFKEEEVLRKRREKSKHKKELMVHASKLRTVSDELEAQRATLRATKKQLGQAQTDNDALHKQLSNVKRDGAHLSNIIQNQRVTHESHTDELLHVKKAKIQLAKRVTVLSKEIQQLQKELADAREELVYKNVELESCGKNLKALRSELRQTTQALDEAHYGNDMLLKQLETIQNGENEWRTKVKDEKLELRTSRERQNHKEIKRMRELLTENQQRSSESSKDVQKLRCELVGVQKLLRRCTKERKTLPVDQWAEVMRNSVNTDDQNTISERVHAFAA